MTQIIVTMAGAGSRFRRAGFDCPKYEIKAHGRTLIEWSLLSLRNFTEQGAHVLFVSRREDQAGDFIGEKCSVLGIRTHDLLEIDGTTDGQATTAMLVEERIADPSDAMLIYNIDTFVHPRSLNPQSVRGDGWIPCFPGLGEGWSFAKTDADGRVLDLKEKVRISDHATVGLYWFSSFNLFATTYRAFYACSENLEKGERYIAPMYRRLIESGKEVYIESIPASDVIPIGTPAELEMFLKLVPPNGN